ncbi:MAG: Na/Pi cotransporter family protein [Firmicutes bacterium]|nr:Na/Pi cotransporter family protein [Bacillota bacterium]
MDIFSVLKLVGGLAFFLYGMNTMSSGLEKMAGGKLETTLKKMTSNPIKSLLLGAGITIAIQSSSAMTVMLVGLVNSGIMQLGQTVGVIMGSNIGTTLTAWLLSLTGIDSGNVFVELLKPENFSAVIALIGVILIMMSKKKRRKDLGSIFVGFSVLMFGMTLMSSSVSGLRENESFLNMLTAFNNPLVGVAVGAIFTGIIQSSAASVGILQALSLTGGISYGMAIPIIMGQNIGTCVTALISSIGVNKNAKRVSVVHILFNIIGTAICLSVFYGCNAVFDFTFTNQAISPVGVAACHSIFNIATTIILLPCSKLLEKTANLVVRDDSSKQEAFSFIDERLLATPSFAISECNSRTVQMAHIAKDVLLDSTKLLNKYSEKETDELLAREDMLDMYEEKLGTYLVKLSSKDLSDADSKIVSKLLHTIGDFERIGDHAVNLTKVAKEIYQKEISFSAEAKAEITVATKALSEILEITTQAFETNDINLASKVEPLEQVIDVLISTIKDNHIRRLQKGNCTIELGFVLSDLLTNYERVSDHCSNVAVAVIEIAQGSFETHEYLNGVKTASDRNFSDMFNEYKVKYSL